MPAPSSIAYSITVNYRESYGLFACNGILFNHESPRRGETFVTRKITRAAARIQAGTAGQTLSRQPGCEARLGLRQEYVEAMWLMLQQDKPDDYVIGTGENHSVREFLELAFGRVGLDWTDHVTIDPRYYRPAEVDNLLADPAKARRQLGWQHRTSFRELVELMVDAESLALASPTRGKRRWEGPVSTSLFAFPQFTPAGDRMTKNSAHRRSRCFPWPVHEECELRRPAEGQIDFPAAARRYIGQHCPAGTAGHPAGDCLPPPLPE